MQRGSTAYPRTSWADVGWDRQNSAIHDRPNLVGVGEVRPNWGEVGGSIARCSVLCQPCWQNDGRVGTTLKPTWQIVSTCSSKRRAAPGAWDRRTHCCHAVIPQISQFTVACPVRSWYREGGQGVMEGRCSARKLPRPLGAVSGSPHRIIAPLRPFASRALHHGFSAATAELRIVAPQRHGKSERSWGLAQQARFGAHRECGRRARSCLVARVSSVALHGSGCDRQGYRCEPFRPLRVVSSWGWSCRRVWSGIFLETVRTEGSRCCPGSRRRGRSRRARRPSHRGVLE